MDTADRSDSKLPAPFPVASSPSVLPRPVFNHDLAVPTAPQIDSHVFLRGLARYWWRILLLWLVISVPVAYLIFLTVGPTYEAVSRIRIEPDQTTLYDTVRTSSGDVRIDDTYLQTQVGMIMSDLVLNRAIANPSVVSQPMITGSKDHITYLREKLLVEIEPNTYIIRVALQSQDPDEAAAIVNAIVESYLAENLNYTQTRDRTLKLSLKEQLDSLKSKIDQKKTELQQLYQNDNLQITQQLPLNTDPSNDEDGEDKPSFTSVPEQHIKQMITALVQIDLDLITARADLTARQEMQKGQQEAELQAQQDDSEIEDRIKEAFLNDPEVIALANDLKKVEDDLEHHKGLIRKHLDPARQAAQRKYDQLKKDYDDLWASKHEEFRKRLRVADGRRPALATIAELQHKIRMLEEKKSKYQKMYEQMKAEQKTTNNAAYKLAYAGQELKALLDREVQVSRNLSQVEFQSQREQYRVTLVDRAAVPKVASFNKRWKYMAAAPVGVLFAMVGLFLLLEIKAQRIADPDALSTRVRSEVYALPLLPTSRELRKRSEPTVDDQIERFIQRLDHLRFAVCGNSVQTGKGRCVLITSAIGGEGKTTLAVQLAARCGNAGMSTLLIDADLQKGDLCTVLDIPPESLGLSDVLKGDSAIEDVVIPVQGGAFSLLCAGTPVRDNSALLQDRRFGMFITQLRQIYDLIIIDSPPVLPIPDALILGRWADGAVLAARYDISRFPQVERARRQLDSAGVAVLGTVINGMRHADAYYGRYTYSRRRSPETGSSSTI